MLEPVTFEERTRIAKEFLERTKLTIPTLIDNMDNKIDANYKAWPERVYIIEIDGKVLYKGEEGPRGFNPLEIKPYFDIVSGVKSLCKISTTWGALKQ